ncbi:hypothetical protein IscW_ISCW001608, partial [Ixodes scapularis]
PTQTLREPVRLAHLVAQSRMQQRTCPASPWPLHPQSPPSRIPNTQAPPPHPPARLTPLLKRHV